MAVLQNTLKETNLKFKNNKIEDILQLGQTIKSQRYKKVIKIQHTP